MSLKSWKSEFYPITAPQAHKTLNLVELVEHSITKWIGLREKNLDKHNLRAGFQTIYDDDDRGLEIDASSCSLCRRFVNFRKEDFDFEKDCIGCPIYESRNGVRCFDATDEEPASPYRIWVSYDDPEPMIKALRKALRWAKRQEVR